MAFHRVFVLGFITKYTKDTKDDVGINRFLRNSGLKMLIPIVLGGYFNSMLLKWLLFLQFLSPFVLSVAFLLGRYFPGGKDLLCPWRSDAVRPPLLVFAFANTVVRNLILPTK